jgi:hypothetical protein
MKRAWQTDNISVFTPLQVELMLNALGAFEIYLDKADSHSPNIPLAYDTVSRLRGKLQAMLSEKNYTHNFGIDVNEVVLLHTSLVLFYYGLTHMPDSVEKWRLQEDCILLMSHFAPLLPAAKLQA